MDDSLPTSTESTNRVSRFELSPPRHFVLPAILLLLSEEPGYGYRLVRQLEDLHFGRIDGPTVYRALNQLESDALVESGLETPTAGQARRVYGLTPLGARVLRAWMGVIKEERDGLDRVLRRYQATGTVDAVLAEVGGGWATALRSPMSPVSPAAPAYRRPGFVLGVPEVDPVADEPPLVIEETGTGAAKRYQLDQDRSVVLIDVRSSVGPISFGADGLAGYVDAAAAHGVLRPGTQPRARLEIAVEGLRSGNRLYDAELLRRIEARRHPTATLDLHETVPVGTGNHYRLKGQLGFHGIQRPVEGLVEVAVLSDRRLLVTGEQVFDIRDYDVPSPTVLMLRIYPDVRVHLHVEAELET